MPIKKVLPIFKCLACSFDSITKKRSPNGDEDKDEDSENSSFIAQNSIVPSQYSRLDQLQSTAINETEFDLKRSKSVVNQSKHQFRINSGYYSRSSTFIDNLSDDDDDYD